MTEDQASRLKPGDRLRLRAGMFQGQARENVDLHVSTVSRVSGPMGTRGPVTVEVIDNEGRFGRIFGEMLAMVDEVYDEPRWYGELMGKEGPRD